MKIQQLNRNNALELITVYSTDMSRPYEDHELDTFAQIITKIYTDGEVDKETKEDFTKINGSYTLGNKEYTFNGKSIKKIFLKNYSYAITFTYAWEIENRLEGNPIWCNNPVEIKIYLKNLQDKKTLKAVKKTIKDLKYELNNDQYILLNSNSENIYTLKKVL